MDTDNKLTFDKHTYPPFVGRQAIRLMSSVN